MYKRYRSILQAHEIAKATRRLQNEKYWESEKQRERIRKKHQSHSSYSYFRNFSTLPFRLKWQLVIVVITTFDAYFSLYITCFNRYNPRYPEIKTVEVLNFGVGTILIINQVLFVIDLLSLTVHKLSNKNNNTTSYKEVSGWCIASLSIAILVDLYSSGSDIIYNYIVFYNLRYLEYLRLLVILRMIRVYYIFKYLVSSVYLNTKVVFLMYFVNVCMLVLLATTLFAKFAWFNVPEEDGKTAEEALYYLTPIMNEISLITWPMKTYADMFVRSLFIASANVVTRGQISYGVDNISKAILTQFTMFAAMLFNITLIATFAIVIIHSELRNVKYNSYREVVKRKVEYIEVMQETKISIKEWYDNLWQYRGGVTKSVARNLLPSGLFQDLCLDTCWPAFKHSQLFRHADKSFLAALSVKMKTVFHSSGDVIYQKGMMKNRMYYICQGSVNVMSVYDNTTPIIHLLPGSCFGESCLYVSYPCSFKVVCLTYCELQVLEKEQLYSLINMYSDGFQTIASTIFDRYIKAKTLFAMKKLKSIEDLKLQVGIYTEGSLKRIKRISRAIDREVFSLESCSSHENEDKLYYITSASDSAMDQYVGTCSDYLDELTISSQTLQDIVSANITTSCPMVFLPSSPFIRLWNFVVMAMVLVMVLMIPYEVGVDTSLRTWQVLVAIVMQILFVVDLLVQCMCTVDLQETSIKTVTEIFFYRITTTEYKADILGSVPLNVLAVCYGVMTVNTWGLLKLNHVMRAWRFIQIFKYYTHQTFLFRSFVLIVAYMCYFFIALCYWGMLLNLLSCYNNVCNPNSMWMMLEGSRESLDHFNVILKTIGYTLTLAFGEGGLRVIAYTRSEHIVTIFLTTFQFFLDSYFIAGVAAVRVLMMKSKELYKERLKTIDKFIRKYKIPKRLSFRMGKFLKMLQRISNLKYFRGSLDVNALSDKLTNELKLSAWSKYFLDVPFFKRTDKNFINDITMNSNMVMFPPNQVICYRGMLPSYFYIIKNGYCQIMTDSGEPGAHKGPGWSFCVLENIFNIPVIETIMSITSCELIYMDKTVFLSVIHNHPHIESEISKTKRECTQLMDLPVLESSVTQMTSDEEHKSFYNFGYDMVVGSKAEQEFLHPFVKVLGSFSFLQFFLLRVVILPMGRAIWCMEVVRGCLALCSSILFPAKFVFVAATPNIVYLFTFLDICAYVDVYCHFHVAYYNEEGVLVTHPLMTAIHYLQNGFLVDFLACLPFERFLTTLIPYASAPNWLCYNRVLQIHRLNGLLSYMRTRKVNSNSRHTIIKHVIFLIIVINVFTSIAFINSCTLLPNMKIDQMSYISDGVECPNVVYNPVIFGTIATPSKIYFIFFLYVCTLLSQTNILSFAVWDRDRIFTTLACFFGYAYIIHVYGEIVAFTFIQKTGLTYQGKIKCLIRYLERSNVNKDLKEEFIHYYNLLWNRHQGTKPINTINVFNFALRCDILNYIYGQSLREFTIFSKTSDFFFQSIITVFIPEVHHKDAVILKEGFVHGNIYILHEGVIIIQIGHRPIMTLGRGAIFGNLFEVPKTQQPVSIIAQTTVEVLAAPTLKFYSIVNGYVYCKELFTSHLREEKCKGMSVIAGQTQPDAKGNVVGENVHVGHKVNILSSFRVQLTKAIISLLTSLSTMYVIAVNDFTVVSLLVCSFFDLLILCTILLNAITPYRHPETGEFVVHGELIREHYRTNKKGLWFDILTIFPFETLALIFSNTVDVFFYLRFNRIFRYLHFSFYIYSFTRRISDKQTTTVIIYLIFTFYCLVFFLCCIILTLHSMYNVSPGDINSYDRAVLFCQALVIRLGGFAHYPMQFILPARQSIILLVNALQLIVGVIAKAIIIGHFLFYVDTYLSDILKYIQIKELVLRELRVQRVAVYLIRLADDYLRYLWDFNHGVQLPDILSAAPITLQQKLMSSLYKHHLTDHTIFKTCESDFLDQVILHVTLELIPPGYVIVHHGTIDSTLYFIHEGKVECLKDGSTSNVTLMFETEHFGDVQGLELVPHENTYKAYTGVLILKLHFSNWSYLMDHFPTQKNRIYYELEKAKAGIYRKMKTPG